MDEVVKWIKAQPYFSASTRRSCGSNGLDEMAMKMVVQMVNVNQVNEPPKMFNVGLFNQFSNEIVHRQLSTKI